jgi:peptidoglycan/xylan/chitin deacetylase (PgdA/CDA1 family)
MSPLPGMPFLVSIDTEEDNWVPVEHGATAENVRALPALDRFFERLGIRATYFVSHQAISVPHGPAIITELAATGRAEIGAHVHPWNTPPYASAARPTMLFRYPYEQQLAKILTVTECLRGAVGTSPVTFRAGRFGFDANTARALVEARYVADSSVTPWFSWEADGAGPSFAGAPVHVYRLDLDCDVRTPGVDGPLIEVPLSSGYDRFSSMTWPRVADILNGRAGRSLRLRSIAARTGIVRRTILSPEPHDVPDMVGLSRGIIAGGGTHLHLFFHSSSLVPGLTPFTPTQRDVDRLYGRIEEYVNRMAGMADLQPCTVAEAAQRLAPPAA